MADEALLALIRSVHLDAPLREVRRELDYLEKHDMLRIERKNDCWHLKLSWQGIDVVEYTSDCPVGIGRPLMRE